MYLMYFRSCFYFITVVGLLLGCKSTVQVHLDPEREPFERLSDYHFFTGKLSDLHPAEKVLPFAPVATLFSDYAEKSRFVWMPVGASAIFNPDVTFAFPAGAVLIKNFFYPRDDDSREIVETRLLVKRADGWDALTYVWNDQQTEAYLEIVGSDKMIVATLPDGSVEPFQYVIPNKNQCKSCHEFNKKLEPIGPKARNLDFEMAYLSGPANQLDKWVEMGYLDRRSEISNPLVDWSDEAMPIHDRALSYLEINCGTCHQQGGAAYVSGLYLTHSTDDPSQLGVCKGPVSAGKGSGGLKYDIVPGQPQASILVHRMITQDPGAMMPEIGRKLVHQEGVALISQWISEMDGGCD